MTLKESSSPPAIKPATSETIVGSDNGEFGCEEAKTNDQASMKRKTWAIYYLLQPNIIWCATSTQPRQKLPTLRDLVSVAEVAASPTDIIQ